MQVETRVEFMAESNGECLWVLKIMDITDPQNLWICVPGQSHTYLEARLDSQEMIQHIRQSLEKPIMAGFQEVNGSLNPSEDAQAAAVQPPNPPC